MAGKGTIINIPKPSPLQLADAYKMFIDAYKENQQVAEIEKTKRVAIEAHKEVELQRLKNQRELLETYFRNIFSERQIVIAEMFDRLDKGIDSNNFDLIQQSLGAIVAIAQESPLKGVQNLLRDYDNSDVDELVI
jgi:hypothetical protein